MSILEGRVMMTLLPIVVIVVLLVLVIRSLAVHVSVQEHEAGLLYESGKLVRTLPPGGHWLFRPYSQVKLLDLRTRVATVPSQEVLTSDNVSIKVSLLLRYKIVKPEVVVRTVVSHEEAIYADAQVALREIVGALAVEDLVTQRDTIAASLDERLKPKAEALGLALESAGIKDFVFPPPLRQVFQRVVEAKKASLASLERARGEVATLRSLANAARMLDHNPSLLALKTLQTIADGKHTIVLGATGSILPLPSDGGSAAAGGASPPAATAEEDEAAE